MTNSISDLEHSEVILVTGSNTTEMHPVISSALKRAVRKRGAELILVDPRKIRLQRYASAWLRPKPGTDVAWINGLLHVILRDGLQNDTFIRDRTQGFEEMAELVKRYTPAHVEEITGIPAADIERAGRLYGRAKKASIVYAMGITQHTTGTDNVKSLANLAMLCGNIGIAGGGVNPLRGQNNVQGACDMGALPNVYSGYQQVGDAAVRERMALFWNVPQLPKVPGKTLTEITAGVLSGQVKAMYIVGENPMLSDPDLRHLKGALRNLHFLVVQDIFMTETAAMADVVLPAASFAEKDGTFTNTERRIQRVRKAIDPIGDCRADWSIIADLSTRLGFPMSYGSPEAIMDEIARVTPSYGGVSYRRIEGVGVQWPCPTPEHPGTPILHKESFTRGKGVFHAIDFEPPPEVPDAEYPLYLSTGRVLYHWHTGSMTRRSAGMSERVNRCEMEISAHDAAKLGLENGQEALVSSRRGQIAVTVTVSEKAVRGTVFIPFHFAEAAVNELTHGLRDPVAKIPGIKVCAVKVEPAPVSESR